MFCTHCGAPIVAGAVFCGVCGKQVSAPATPGICEAQMQQFQQQKAAIRHGEMQALASAYAYFSQKSEPFQAYDTACKLLNHYSRGTRNSLLIWGCIIGGIGFFAMISVFLSHSNVGAGIWLFLGAIPMIVGGILMKVNNRKNYSLYQKKYAELSKELNDYYLAYPNCPVGPEYANPLILATLYNTLQSGQADTVKESINLLTAGVSQSRIRAYLADLRQNTYAIDAQNRVSVIFLPASFFM